MKAVAENKKSTAKPAIAQQPHETMVIEGSEIGEVKIHENVIASLVRRAALGIEGVSRLAGNALVDNIAEIVGSRRMQSRAISIDIADDNRVAIEVKLNIKFGYKVPELAEKVQQAIINDIESTTGMTVPRVNVLIQEIDDPDTDSDDSDTESAPNLLPMN